jgi:hypothetical protein
MTTGLDPNVLSNFDGWGYPQNQDGFFAGDTWFPLVTFQEDELIAIWRMGISTRIMSLPTSAPAASPTPRAPVSHRNRRC